MKFNWKLFILVILTILALSISKKSFAEYFYHESCKDNFTTSGCKIIETGHWDLIDCNGKRAYYLPQICHEEHGSSHYIYISGKMYVWSYEIGDDGEIINTLPCDRDYSCENDCFEKRIKEYRKFYTDKNKQYCNEEWCGLEPFTKDHPCGCLPKLLTPDRCNQKAGK